MRSDYVVVVLKIGLQKSFIFATMNCCGRDYVAFMLKIVCHSRDHGRDYIESCLLLLFPQF